MSRFRAEREARNERHPWARQDAWGSTVHSMIRSLARIILVALIVSPTPSGRAGAQMDPQVLDDVAAATVMLSALVTTTENGSIIEQQQCFLGSGTIVSPNGRYILTNSHVMSGLDAAKSHAETMQATLLAEQPERHVTVQVGEIVVSVVDSSFGIPDRRYRAEEKDRDETLDLAILRITGDSPGRDHEGLVRRPHIPLDLTGAQPGEAITLVGYPAFAPGATDNPACAPVPETRSVQIFPGAISGFGGVTLDRLVVTAMGSGGMSGGAAVNADGELVGIPSQIQQMATGGVVEVIPVEQAFPMLEEFIPGITTRMRGAPTPSSSPGSAVATTFPPTATALPTLTPSPSPPTLTPPTPTPTMAPPPTPLATAVPPTPIRPTPTSLPGTSRWAPMFRGDPRRTGTMPGPRPAGEPTVRWQFETDGIVVSSPAVVNGVVYVGSRDFNVYAIDATSGEERWHFPTGGDVASSPAVVDGMVFIGSRDSNMYALDADTGSIVWSFKAENAIHSSPVVVEGAVYFGSNDGHVYALDQESGAELWSFDTGDEVSSSPAVFDGVVYVGSHINPSPGVNGGALFALDTASGKELWRFNAGRDVGGSPAIANGIVYFGSRDSRVYALEAATGAEIWQFVTGNAVYSSPAVSNGTVYIGSEDGNVYALNAETGAQIWRFTTGDDVGSSPAVVDWDIYVGSENGSVYALDAATGFMLWQIEIGDAVSSSPAVVNGIVYFGSDDGSLYAYGG